MAALATIVFGFIVGYLGQKSRFCIVSGIRDFFLLKNVYRIQGLIGIIVGGFLGFLILSNIGADIQEFPMPAQIESGGYLLVSIIGGLGIGFFSVLAEGCPFRQHVMASEGSQSALFYLLGFYIGIVYFLLVTVRFLEAIIIGLS